MRISRRTSGGRGEYEISETAPNGLAPKDLFFRRILLVFGPDWVVDSGVQLTNQGGNRRLRLLDAGMQLHRQVAAALMMPHSVRTDASLGRRMPILQADLKGKSTRPVRPLGDCLPWHNTGNRLHPNQKPVPSLKPIIETFTERGELVLDPFCGSGTSLLARQDSRQAVLRC